MVDSPGNAREHRVATRIPQHAPTALLAVPVLAPATGASALNSCSRTVKSILICIANRASTRVLAGALLSTIAGLQRERL